MRKGTSKVDLERLARDRSKKRKEKKNQNLYKKPRKKEPERLKQLQTVVSNKKLCELWGDITSK